MNLNDMKREHNALQRKARKQYAKVVKMSQRIDELRGAIQNIECDNHNPIPLLFGGDLNIYAEDEVNEQTNAPETA